MIKLADTLAPMADFPAVMAEHTAFEDGETLQEKYETGQLGGGGGGYTQLSQAEYDALTEDEEMDGREYRTYDTGHIYKLGVEYGKDADISRSEVLKTYTSLYNLNIRKGLSLQWENNVDNTQKIIDALEGREEFIDSFSSSTNRIGIVGNYGTTINNFHIIKRSADLAIITATTNDGTILNRTYTNGTLSDWCVNIAVYTSLEQLGLTADATVEDVVNALKSGESFLAPVNTFTNYETIFPNKLPNDQWNKIHIIKGTSLANSHIRCFSQSGTCEYLANINNTNVVSWNDVSGTYIDVSDAVIEKLGNEILKYPVGKYRINSTATGNKFIDLPSDAETKCGLIEVNGTAVGKSPFTDTWVYRMYKFECLTGISSYVRRLNSGATAGQIEVDSGWCVKQNIYTSLEELGLTAPTTVGEVFMAMPEKSMLMLNVEALVDDGTNVLTVTDVPKEFGVLTIEKHIYGRFRIEYSNSLGGAVFNARKWIGALKGSDGTGLVWKEVNTGNHKYTTMAELGLDGATATVQDVIDKVAVGDSVMMRTDAFNNDNWKTQCNGIQWGYLKIEKTMSGLSNIELQEVITPNRRYFGTQSSGKFAGWVQMITEKSDPYTCTKYTALTGTEDLFTLPCGHYVSDKINTAYNYPITDSSNATAHIYVLGCLNEPANNKGYRIILYFDNKNRMYRINEWWGSFSNGWKEIATKDYIDSKIADLQAQINALK